MEPLDELDPLATVFPEEDVPPQGISPLGGSVETRAPRRESQLEAPKAPFPLDRRQRYPARLAMPPDRLKLLREAFMATMKDPEFIAETQQRKLALEPESGEELEALIKKAYATPKPIIERIGKLIQ